MGSTVPEVAFNRWDRLVPAPDRSAVSVSVVIPFFERPAALARVLGALQPQLVLGDEVVVVDDGSRPGHDEIVVPDGMDLRVLRRHDEGFRLAAARNDGAADARGDVLLFLDDDMVPQPGWVRAHARWHAAIDGLLTIGSRVHVDPTAGAEAQGEPPSHVAGYLAWSRALTAPTDDLFRICSGGNLGLRRATFERIGGFDPSASRYGGEDIELGYRAVQRGCVLVPVTSAGCRHLGPPGFTDPVKAAENRAQRAWMADRIAHPSFRSTAPGRTYPVPSVRVVVMVDRAEPPSAVEEVVEAVLASSVSDLDVHVVAEPAGPLADLLSGDRRVVVGPAGEGPLPGWAPDTPVHVLVGSGVRLDRRDVADAVAALRRHAVGVVHRGPPAAPVATATLTRALARAAWAGADDVVRWAEEVFGVRWLPTERRTLAAQRGQAGVDDDLATIRYALRRLPAPAVHALAGSLRVAVRARSRLARAQTVRPR